MANWVNGGVALLLAGVVVTPGWARNVSADIVVTAEKREESVQKVPISMSVLADDVISREHIKDLLQAAPLIDGMIFSRAPDDGLGITYRGLGAISRSAAFEQPISLFQDGIPLAKGRLYTTAFFDVDRMEFIRGSESSLLGQNSSLGAISVVDRQPGRRASFDGAVGNEFLDGGYTLDAAGDVPVSGHTALRIAAHYDDLAGWVHNDALDRDGPEQQDLGTRAILRVTPAAGLTVTASIQHSRNRQIGQSMQLVGAIPAIYGDGRLDDHNSNYTAQTDDHQTLHRTISNIAGLKGELGIGDHTLIAQTSYVGYHLYYLDDLDFSIDDTVNFRRAENYRQFTQELRLVSPSGGRVDYMAGAFFLRSHWHSVETQLWTVPDFPPPPDPASGQLFAGDFVNDFVQDSCTYAAYASGHWHAAARVTLGGGVRFSRETKTIVYGRTPLGPLTIWNTVANPPFAPTPLAHRSDFLDGNVTASYALRPGAIAYASYGHGSKAGGFVETNTIAVAPAALVDGKVPAALVAAGSALKDEIAQSYEAGVKTLWLNKRLRINAAAFWTQVRDFQDNVFTGGALGFISFNGPARSRGFEIDSGIAATRRLALNGSLTYADATAVIRPIDPATAMPVVNAAGQPVYARYRRSQAPTMIVNAGAHYTIPLSRASSLRADAILHHRSSMYNQRQDGYLSQPLTMLDIDLGVARANDGWQIDLSAMNITNAIAEDFASATVDPRFGAFYRAHAASPNRNRTLTLTVRVKM